VCVCVGFWGILVWYSDVYINAWIAVAAGVELGSCEFGRLKNALTGGRLKTETEGSCLFCAKVV